jgi:RDD family
VTTAQQGAISPVVSDDVPGIVRRIATLPYEGLLLLALLLIASFPFAGLKGAALSGVPQFLFQAYLFAVTSVYFTWFWRNGGQTLPMKTWRFKLVDRAGRSPDLRLAMRRLLLAALFYGPACAALVLLFFPKRVSPAITMWGFLPLIATIWWAKFDADRQFLHDRLAGTRLVNAETKKP